MNKTEDVLEETSSNTFAPNNVNSSWKTNGTTTWQLPQESSLLSDALGKIHWHGNLGAAIFLPPPKPFNVGVGLRERVRK